MRTRMYADTSKCRTTNENANIWADTLQVTKDTCVERQKEMHRGTRVHLAGKSDWPIMIWSKPRISWRSLESVKVRFQSVRHTFPPKNGGVGCRYILHPQ